mmetsp:Transcript_18847/g.21684  ORF Transcript_18847/g.21684 Transcript_18847/m.21684 type:complete len:131 (-) Transcript_18847:81-473(-)
MEREEQEEMEKYVSICEDVNKLKEKNEALQCQLVDAKKVQETQERNREYVSAYRQQRMENLDIVRTKYNNEISEKENELSSIQNMLMQNRADTTTNQQRRLDEMEAMNHEQEDEFERMYHPNKSVHPSNS